MDKFNKLKLYYYNPTSNPRNNKNLGLFLIFHKEYKSPDDNKKFYFMQQKEIKNIDDMKKYNNKILYVYPITRYYHGFVEYSITEHHDKLFNGYYIVLENEITKSLKEKEIKNIVTNEIDIYNKYINGESYCFEEYDDNNNLINKGYELYDIMSIKNQLKQKNIIQQGDTIFDFLNF